MGSEAFRRLDAFMSKPADDCDEALEWIPSLSGDDWHLLETVWPERSAEWRANCAHIAGHFAVPPSLALLRRALDDHNELVAAEAAIALCGQILEHPELVAVDQRLLQRLQELKRGDKHGVMDEVREVLRLFGGAG